MEHSFFKLLGCRKSTAHLILLLILVFQCGVHSIEHWALSQLERVSTRIKARQRLISAALANHVSAHRRGLREAATQSKCVWSTNSALGTSISVGSCELNEYYVLTLPGRLQSQSARILALLHYKSTVCSSYTFKPDCYRNSSDACAWDTARGLCYISDTALYDPEVLRERLYCTGSLLDAAARCALMEPHSGGGCSQQGGAGTGGSGKASGGAIGQCIFMNTTALSLLDEAAVPYVRVAELVSYSSTDPGATGGRCVARWVTERPTLDRLMETVTSSKHGGLLQRDLLGQCEGVAELLDALTAAVVNCSSPELNASAEACGASPRCRWDSATGACGVHDTVLYDLLYDSSDPWVVALSQAADQCSDQLSRTACESAGGTITVDTTRMAALQNALAGGSLWPDNESGGGGGRGRGGGATGWAGAGGGQLRLAVAVAGLSAAVLAAAQWSAWRLF